MDPGFHPGLLMRGHSNFVSAVCVMPPDSTYEQGLLITGSNDKTILGYTPDSPEPVFKLTGHEGNGTKTQALLTCYLYEIYSGKDVNRYSILVFKCKSLI